MNYKQMVDKGQCGDLHIVESGKAILIKNEFGNVAKMFQYDSFMKGDSKATARLICHHKRHFERLVEALKGLNMAYNQGRMPTIEERTACKMALADADKVE